MFLFRGGLVRKMYFLVTVVVTVFAIGLGTNYMNLKKENLLNRKHAELLEAAAGLAKDISEQGMFEAVRAVQHADLSVDEKILSVNNRFQADVNNAVGDYPEIGFGLYSRELNRNIAMGPDISVAQLLSVNHYDHVYDVYNSPRTRVARLNSSVIWGDHPVLNVQYPLYHNGQIIGHVWASQKAEMVQAEMARTLAGLFIIIFFCWLTAILVTTFAFSKLFSTSLALANQLRQEGGIPAAISDFPELEPIRTTIDGLKRELLNRYQEKLKIAEEHRMVLKVRADLLDIAQTSIFVLDDAWRFSYLNIEAARAWGNECDDLIGKNIWDTFPALVGSCIFSRYHEAVATNTDLSFEALSPVNNRWFEFRVKPTDYGLVIASNDITERKRLAMQYQNTAAELNQIIEVCPVGIFVVDKAGTVVTANKAYRDKLPADLPVPVIRTLSEATDQSDRGCALGAVTGLALAGELCQDRELTCCDRSWIVNASPLTDSAGDVLGAVTVVQDISEYKKLSGEMERLDRLSLISQMAGGFAHEIRNPITVIKGYLQFLRRKTPAKISQQFDLVLTEISRVESIIKDFLALASNKGGDLTKENLNQIIRDMHPLLYAQAMKKGIVVKLMLDEKVPDIYVDSKEIKQLLLNLFCNSVEAITAANGKITVETKLDGDKVQVSVADNGCGIPPERKKKIFDPFFSTKETGTGLGLSVCTSIVHRQNGTISVDSRPGRGTKFVIQFPRDRRREGEPSPATTPAAAKTDDGMG